MLFLKALSVFLGTIIGAGIFGLPFVAYRAGFFITLVYFLFMSLIVISVSLIYSQIALGTKKTCRLPGYVESYLGEKWKKISFVIACFGLFGALLAYLIIGGQFLGSSLDINPVLGTLLFFALGSYLTLRGIKAISGIEFILFLVLLVILGLFFIKALPFVNLNNFQLIDLKYLAFPYGVILFSLWGVSVVPEIKEMLLGDKNSLRKVIILGVVLSALIYLFFIYLVIGASSPVSEDAISGLDQVLGSNILKLGFIFGVITCFTSFLTLGLTLKKILWYDFGFSKHISWFLTCFVPLGLFLLGFRRFINVIGFTGAIALALEGIIIVFLYKAFLKKKFRKRMNPLFYLLSCVFLLGIAVEIILFLW